MGFFSAAAITTIAVGAVVLIALIAVLTVFLLKKSNNECKGSPPKFPDLYSDWNGKSRIVSTKVQYRCGYVQGTPLAIIVQCTTDRKWQLRYEDLKACQLDKEGQDPKDEFEKEANIFGCQRSEPPEAGNYYRDWNRLRWEVGTKIDYYCAAEANAPLAKTIVCSNSNHWVVKKDHNISCECLSDPPLYHEHKDKMIWDEENRWMGTVMAYTCTTNVSSRAVWKLVKCNIKNQWEVIETRKCD